MRKPDVVELQASTGFTPKKELRRQFQGNPPSSIYSIVLEERILGMFGASAMGTSNRLRQHGVPWLLCTDELMDDHWRSLARDSQYWVNVLLEDYLTLSNCVHTRNKAHLNWLRWIGFEISDKPINFGVKGELFYRFQIHNPSKVAPHQRF